METLYHIRKFSNIEDDYNVGQVLEFNRDKLNSFKYDQKDYSGSYYAGKITIGDKVCNHYKDIASLLKYEELKNKSEAEIKEILSIINTFHYTACLEKREMILEEIRRESYIDKPSRYHCMWLTDEECIASWIKLLKAQPGKYSINEMELDGDIFVSTDELLPGMYHKTEDMYEEAKHYWNPKKEDLTNSKSREYLFEGIAKVKRKIK
jgi:hypothetical protein